MGEDAFATCLILPALQAQGGAQGESTPRHFQLGTGNGRSGSDGTGTPRDGGLHSGSVEPSAQAGGRNEPAMKTTVS